MGPEAILGIRPTDMRVSALNSVLASTAMVRLQEMVWPLWVKVTGIGRLRLSEDSSRICSQVG